MQATGLGSRGNNELSQSRSAWRLNAGSICVIESCKERAGDLSGCLPLFLRIERIELRQSMVNVNVVVLVMVEVVESVPVTVIV
jgi:hypothetical protein